MPDQDAVEEHPTRGARGLLSFIDASPSPYHAVRSAAARLVDDGFVILDETDAWLTGPGRYVVVRGGSLVAWESKPASDPLRGFRIIGAHTDSPNLRIKPRPDTGGSGARQLGVEVYGGVLLNSWLDRDLGLSGRVSVRDGRRATTREFRVDRPLLRVPQLAIHLDRGVNDGLKLNPQQHLVPVWGLGSPDEGAFRRFLAKEIGVTEDAVLSWDAMLHDLTPSSLLGVDDEFVSAPRIDNLASCHAAVEALSAQLGATDWDGEHARRRGDLPVRPRGDRQPIGDGRRRVAPRDRARTHRPRRAGSTATGSTERSPRRCVSRPTVPMRRTPTIRSAMILLTPFTSAVDPC